MQFTQVTSGFSSSPNTSTTLYGVFLFIHFLHVTLPEITKEAIHEGAAHDDQELWQHHDLCTQAAQSKDLQAIVKRNSTEQIIKIRKPKIISKNINYMKSNIYVYPFHFLSINSEHSTSIY